MMRGLRLRDPLRARERAARRRWIDAAKSRRSFIETEAARRQLLAAPDRDGLTIGDLYQWVQQAIESGVDPRTRVRATVGFRQQVLEVYLRLGRPS